MSLREILLTENSFSSSWTAENKNVFDSVTWSESYSEDLETVSLDTCVRLSRSDGLQDCQPEISFVLQQKFSVTRITVVSDARIVEVYGACGEYVGTQNADFMDEFEDMSVYVAEMRLPQPLSECAIKFAGLKSSDQMWLYGIHLTVQETPSKASPKKLINFHNVNNMIQRSGCKLSEKAERCQNFLETYASSVDPLTSVEVTGLLKMLETRCPKNGEGGRNLVDLISRFSQLPGLIKEVSGAPVYGESPESECKSPSNLGDSGNLDSVLCSLRDSIDRRIAQSEMLVLARVDEKLRQLEARQTEKLDLILHHLKMLNEQHSESLT